MSLTLGLCCATDGSDNWQALADLGQPPARVALTKDHSDVPQWHRMQGRRVVGVVAAETFAAFGYSILDQGDHHRGLVLVQQRWGALCDWIEIGNEPDDAGSASSGMPAKTWENLITTACAVFHTIDRHDTPQLISGGLSTGQPPYLNGISIPACFWLGLHSYNQRLRGWPSADYGFGDLDGYLDAYRPWWSKCRGIALSEWGVTDDAPEFASEYIRRFLQIIRERPEVKLAAWFSLNDAQSPTRHGLIRRDGTRKPQFDTYKEEIHVPTAPAFVVGQGIKDAMAKHGDEPMGDEFYPAAAYSMAPGKKFMYIYSFQANQVYLQPLA